MPHVRYEEPSCENLDGPFLSTTTSEPECRCAEGYVREHGTGQCIPPEQCGCTGDGSYHSVSMVDMRKIWTFEQIAAIILNIDFTLIRLLLLHTVTSTIILKFKSSIIFI